MTPLEIEIYKPDPAHPGQEIIDHRITGRELVHGVAARLQAEFRDHIDYITSPVSGHGWDLVPLPTWQWIACYAVTGGSEGHYVHVDLILKDGTRMMVLIAKTFSGMESAYRIAGAIAEILGA